MKKLIYLVAVVILLVSYGFKTVDPASTSIKISVLDNLGNMVEGATVTLYTSKDDYRNETNPAQEPGITDAKGVVKFKKISAVKYFIYVTKGDMNNIGNGVETDPLEEGKLNKLTIVIE